MDSRAIVPEQHRVGRGKPTNYQADAVTRRVLRDLKNLEIAPPVKEKHHAKITCAKTNFGAQLLQKAQLEAEKNNGKKPLAKNVNGLLVGKENIDPKKEDVIVISSEESEIYKSARKSSKKKGRTFTSTLTARSKAACGLTKKPRDPIIDIDSGDVKNELAAVEYIEDMYSYYKLTEDDCRVRDYMNSQPEINSEMRAILVDWLIEVHRKFELMPESLYLTINIIDRFLSMKRVARKEFQLVGISSMLIACKYEEIWAPEVRDFTAVSDNAYSRNQVLIMEKSILEKLEWYLTVPTPYVFLTRYIKASLPSDNEMENTVFFYAELGLVNYSTIVLYSHSIFAASAVYAARCTLKRVPLWTETLKHHTGYEESELMDCAKLLLSFHAGEGDGRKLKTVLRKYSSVALLTPAKSLLCRADE